MGKIGGLIIDFDNTLVSSKDFIEKHLNLTLANMGENAIEHEKIMAILKKNLPFEKIFEELFGIEKGSKILAIYREKAQETPYSANVGALTLVEKMNEEGIPIVLTTNRFNLIDLRLEQAGFKTSSFAGKITPVFPKPDSHAYNFSIDFLNSFGVKREEIKIIGDSVDDFISVPDDLKKNFIGVLTGLDEKDDFIKAGLMENQIIQNLEEFNGPTSNNKIRKNSVILAGGEFGDEGKGKLTDAWVKKYAKNGKVIVYRDNGGSNAGHTLEFDDGRRVSLHQLPSGVFVKEAIVFLSKGMVLHPSDLVEEINQVKIVGGESVAQILIDEMAVLALDTHRAFEAILKTWEEGGKGSTAKGISPAYSDVLLRHPLRMRDLVRWDEEKIEKHYRLYEALIKGLGVDLAKVEVSSYSGKILVGTLDDFKKRLKYFSEKLKPMIISASEFLKTNWADESVAFVFEKAMAIGLDARWGVYPDVTASDTTFEGIRFSSEGIIDPALVEKRVIVLKGTYMSSVGTRKIPTLMEEQLAQRIRNDYQEYGATTNRMRDIAYIDLPALKFYRKVSKPNCLIQTHADATYPDLPIKICIAYEINGKEVDYRPDQEFLNKVTPKYIEMSTWESEAVHRAKNFEELPQGAKDFLNFINKELDLPLLAVSTGPKRDQWFECE